MWGVVVEIRVESNKLHVVHDDYAGRTPITAAPASCTYVLEGN